jgi:hypothetical protein
MKNLVMIVAIVVIGALLYSGVKMTRESQSPMPVATTKTMNTNVEPVASVPAASVSPQDQAWESSQTTSTGTDETSLEKDINGTTVPTEDFSDLK